MIRMINQGTLVAHHLDVFLAVVVNFHIRVLVTVDVDWGHLRFQLLDVVKVLLRYVMCDAVKWALQLVVHGLQKQIETVETKFIPARKYEHLSVYLVVELITVGTVVSPCTVCGHILHCVIELLHLHVRAAHTALFVHYYFIPP